MWCHCPSVTGVVSADVHPGALPPVFQYTEIWSPPTLIRGVAPGGLLPSTIVWLALAVVRIQASNVAAPVDTDAAQFPPTLPQPSVAGKSSTGPVTAVPMYDPIPREPVPVSPWHAAAAGMEAG